MPYEALLARLAQLSGYPENIIKDVLSVFPDALLSLKEGEKVRTPLGMFRMVRKVARPVKLPGQDVTAQVAERLQVRLSAGQRLRKVAT